jgi:hypothetical protein
MRDPPAPHLLVAGEQRQYRQPGGIGARPARGPQSRPAQAPRRARAGRPAAVLAAQREQLVQPAAAAVDEQRVAVAVGVATASMCTRRGIG